MFGDCPTFLSSCFVCFKLNLLSVTVLDSVKMFGIFAFFWSQFSFEGLFPVFLSGAQRSCVLTVSVALVSVARMCQFCFVLFCFVLFFGAYLDAGVVFQGRTGREL